VRTDQLTTLKWKAARQPSGPCSFNSPDDDNITRMNHQLKEFSGFGIDTFLCSQRTLDDRVSRNQPYLRLPTVPVVRDFAEDVGQGRSVANVHRAWGSSSSKSEVHGTLAAPFSRSDHFSIAKERAEVINLPEQEAQRLLTIPAQVIRREPVRFARVSSSHQGEHTQQNQQPQ
jgi:hypothetical protein